MTHKTEHEEILENPYDSGGSIFPVSHPEKLYGRQRIIEKIMRGVLLQSEEPTCFAIVGLTRIGKTSLLDVITKLKAQNSQFFIDKFGIEPERIKKTVFIKVDFSELPAEISPEKFWAFVGRHFKEAVEEQAPCKKLPKGPNSTDNDDFNTDLSFMINDGFALVFLMDEFEHVPRRLPPTRSANLRSTVEKRRTNLAYITATRQPLYQYYEEDIELGSQLFNYFKTLYLGLLEESPQPRGIENFIRDVASEHGVNFTDPDVDFAKTHGGRHPDLTRLACAHLFDARKKDPDGTLNYSEIHENLVRDFRGILHIIWRGLNEQERDALRHLAKYQPDQARIPKNTLKDLADRSLVVYRDTDYRLFSPVLKTFIVEEVNDGNENGVKDIVPELKAVRVGNKLQPLTSTEWKLFTYLYNHAGRVCQREDLMQAAASNGKRLTRSALDTNISRLRQKLGEQPDHPDLIVTVHGQGYRFEHPSHEKEKNG